MTVIDFPRSGCKFVVAFISRLRVNCIPEGFFGGGLGHSFSLFLWLTECESLEMSNRSGIGFNALPNKARAGRALLSLSLCRGTSRAGTRISKSTHGFHVNFKLTT